MRVAEGMSKVHLSYSRDYGFGVLGEQLNFPSAA